jgi:para-nitrobenzyl esterase
LTNPQSEIAAAVGCGEGTADVASCLRGVSTTTAQTTAGQGYQNGGHGTVAPTINGTTLTMTLRQALARGQANHVDVIAGTDRDEDLVGTATTAAQYTSLVDTQYGSFASQVLARYPLSHFDSPGIAWRTVAADSDTVCPALTTAQNLAQRMPVREYEIDDNDIAPYAAAGSGVVAPGASHVGAWYFTPVTPLTPTSTFCRTRSLPSSRRSLVPGTPTRPVCQGGRSTTTALK